ncbi:hypothetical protein SESBI_02524 [Sesbania bispinosa]|nr:hypothetical protein SESBI_02524 [Sesbania bispinosa]
MINKLLAQSVVRPPLVKPSGMVMPVASLIPSISLLRRSKPIFNPPTTISSTTRSVSIREPIHTTPPTSRPVARSGNPTSMPPHTGGVSEDTFQAASGGVQQKFMQFMPTPRLQQNPPSNK